MTHGRLVQVAGEITLDPPRKVAGAATAAQPPHGGAVDLDRLLGFSADDEGTRRWSLPPRARRRGPPPWLRALGRMFLVFVVGLGLGLWLGHGFLARCDAPRDAVGATGDPQHAAAAALQPTGAVVTARGQ